MTHMYRFCKNEHAVSPVVGVMLMLVVVVIIAAVVSGFAGSLIGTSDQKAPNLMMDVKIINMGSWTGSGFFATVTGVSEPIPTKDLKIVTSWKARRVMGSSSVTREEITGGNTTMPGVQNINVLGDPTTGLGSSLYVAPFGVGPGVNGTETIADVDTQLTSFSGPRQQFGNYSLMSGTSLVATACGAGSFDYIGGTSSGTSSSEGYGVGTLYRYSGGPYIDPVSAVLGSSWENLRWGDIVNVKVIHIPSGKVIFQQDVPVKEG